MSKVTSHPHDMYSYSKPSIPVQRLLNRCQLDLELRLAAGVKGLERMITEWAINRPALALAGFTDHFDHHRIQVFGSNEIAFLESLTERKRMTALSRILDAEPPCIIVSTDRTPSIKLLAEADKRQIPLLLSSLNSSALTAKLVETLMDEFAPRLTAHGALVHVFGLGVLISGKSGVGKSECSLELIARGHRLVADDIVIIRRRQPGMLMGAGSEVVRHHMEIQGAGIVDIMSLYGVGAVMDETQINVHIQLEAWRQDMEFDRVGMEDRFTRILGILVPEYILPVEPGRNLSIIVETVVLNQMMKNQGINTAARFNERLIRRMAPVQSPYFSSLPSSHSSPPRKPDSST